MHPLVFNPTTFSTKDLPFGPSKFVVMDGERGCSWNNQLEKEIFRDNFETHGIDYAKSYLRENIKHWTAKREGRVIPQWEVMVNDQGHFTVGDRVLVDLAMAPITDKNSTFVEEDVKRLVPVEVETLRQGEKMAQHGAKIIYLPEHSPAGIRYMTVLTQDPKNPRRYIGTQQDLGKNFSFDQAKIRMSMSVSHPALKVNQSDRVKDAFVFGVNELVYKNIVQADYSIQKASVMESIQSVRQREILELREIKKENIL